MSLISVKNPFQNGESGTTLVTMIVVLAMGAIGGLIAATIFSRMSTQQSMILREQTKAAARLDILARFDCNQTLGPTRPANCATLGTYLTAKDRNGAAIIAGSGTATRMGEWAVRVTCDGTNKEVNIETAATSASVNVTTAAGDSKFKKDPVKNIPYDWNHPNSKMFAPGAGICKSMFTVGTSINFCPSPGTVRTGRCTNEERIVSFDPVTKNSCCLRNREIFYTVYLHELYALQPLCNTSTFINAYGGISGACLSAAHRYCGVRGYWVGYIYEYAGPPHYISRVDCMGKLY